MAQTVETLSADRLKQFNHGQLVFLSFISRADIPRVVRQKNSHPLGIQSRYQGTRLI